MDLAIRVRCPAAATRRQLAAVLAALAEWIDLVGTMSGGVEV
jgi:hypothetical protein